MLVVNAPVALALDAGEPASVIVVVSAPAVAAVDAGVAASRIASSRRQSQRIPQRERPRG
jgi:hypothetical protein